MYPALYSAYGTMIVCTLGIVAMIFMRICVLVVHIPSLIEGKD